MRLIDADALDVLTIIGGRMNGKAEFAKAVNEMIQNAPTIDAVPVQCKDCKYFADRFVYEGKSFCKNMKIRSHPELALVVDTDFYCGYGEKRDETDSNDLE